jgi:uncharacterized protein involved in exopolysaccharide biosynthesis
MEIVQRSITTVPSSSLTPRVGIEAFFRHKKLFFWVASLTLLLTVLVTFSTRKQYLSEMKFIVQNTRGNVMITPEKTNSTSVVNDVTEAQVNSEVELLHSHDVLDPIADPEWVAIPESQRTAAQVNHHEKLLSAFEKRFGTEVVRRTNVINVTVLAPTPEKAHGELERLSSAYLAEHRRLQRPNGVSNFFAAETERMRKDWDEASQKLVNFQTEHQIFSLSAREVALENQISEREQALLAADANLRELYARQSASSKRLNELPMRQTTVERVLPNQESVEHLNTLLVELENKRTALVTNYAPSERTVRELDQEIATTKAALHDAATITSQEKTTDVDPAWQQLHKDFVETEISHRQAGAHRGSVITELASLKQSLASLQGLTVEFNNLEAHAKQLKENYELYAQKRDQAQIEDSMDEQKLMNVGVAEQPTLSYVAVKPKPVTNILLGFVTALFLGFCAVYFAEMGRNTIATPRELDSLSRYPVLATVPLVTSWTNQIPARSAVPRALPQPLEEARV